MVSPIFHIFFLVIVTCSWALTPHDPCPGVPPVVSLDLKGCTQLPCTFVKGTQIEFIIEVLADHDIKTLTADVKAFALGTETSYPLPGDVGNVCDHLMDGECPLEKGEDVKYHLLFPISESYPTIPLVIQFSIVSEFGTTGCLRLPSVVVDG